MTRADKWVSRSRRSVVWFRFVSAPRSGKASTAQWHVGEIMGEAHMQLDVPAALVGEALRRSAITNGGLASEAAEEFFARVAPREPEV
ncbi:hypothetical protein GCM10010431_72560 [Streptomyces kunmingensis]